MKKENTYNALKIMQIIRALLLIIMSLMVISTAIIGHCASEQYYFPMLQNENGHFTETYKNVIDNAFNSEDNYIFVSLDQTYSGAISYVAYVFPKTADGMIYGEIYNNAYQFSLYSIGNTNGHTYYGYIYDNGQIDIYDHVFSYFTGLNSSSYSSTNDYVSNYQVVTNNTDSAKPVLLYDDGLTIPDDDTARDDMEKPNIQDYIPDWSNKPTFDNSTVESALESVYDGVIWLGDNIKDTITGTGEYIADTVRWATQKTINTIRSKIDEIKGVINDVKGFVSDIKDFVSYVAEPLDVSTLQTTITGSTAFGDISTITGSFADFKAVFDNTSEPNEYKIPLHLENISILGQTQTQYIDLGIIASQRPLIRAFCWVVTTFSLFVTVIDALPNYLKGGDE